MKTISIICQKGGVGKTTAVVNLSTIFSKKGYRTLIIDLDPQGNVSTYLNFDKNTKNVTSSIDLLSGVTEIFTGELSENLSIIPSNKEIARYNDEKIIGGAKISKLKKYGLFNEFDFVFIDTPPTMSSLVQEGIAASDYYLIPTKPEFLAIEGVAQAMSFAKTTLKNIPNVNAIFLGVLLNQVETRRASYEEFLSELEYLLGDRLFKTKISHLTEIADSPFYGKTVIDFNKESKARIQFNKLAEEIIERVDKNEEIT
ncbi:MAG: ParA family protein [Candidatus Actinomarinales bacterium]|nr:MAG: ParA family protein [Candidatus Actinomarinales bacterium]